MVVWIGSAANLRLVAYQAPQIFDQHRHVPAVARHGSIVMFSNASMLNTNGILFRADAYYSAQRYLLSTRHAHRSLFVAASFSSSPVC